MNILYFRLSNIDVSIYVVCRGLIVGRFFFFTKLIRVSKPITVYIAICYFCRENVWLAFWNYFVGYFIFDL